MDLLANYDDDGEKSQSSSSNKQDQVEVSSSLQAEWESFEKMISGENEDAEKPTSVNEFLQAGIVAYPGSFQNNTETEKESKGSSSSEEEAEGPKKSRSFADDVMKLFRSEFVEEELDMPPRARSSSHSSGSSHSSRSASASPSPDREEEKEGEHEKKPDKETSKEVKEDRRQSTEGQFSRKRSRSRSRNKQTSHSRKKSRSSRSRSRSRRRSRDRKGSSSHRRHRRSRSRDRKHRRRSSRDRHRHKKDRRRSRSRDRHRKRSHRSRSRHRSRSPHKHRSGKSRSRSRDRGHHPAPSSSKPEGEKHLTFKEKMRQQLLKASKYLQAGEGGLEVEGTPKEKPSNLPLSDGHKRFFEALASSTQSSVTPQMALLHTMAAMHQKAQEMTGVAVPKYYNPAAVNPLKYAEQVQKRKLLWSKAKEHKEDKEKEWQHTAFNQDENGKIATKFKKLMGMKEGGEEGGDTAPELTEEQKKKREELFSRLDKDYEFARMTTHTQRGVGLGFSSQGIQPP